jgi:enamine deaminase RidA (YjgF/YER057c/UK114 family)
MMKRKNISSGTPWEETVGYSRAVRLGPYIHISGTTAVDGEGRVQGLDDPHAQARYILKKIEDALRQAGGGLEDVVRTRMYVVRIEDWEAVGRAHGEFFRDVKPAATLVEVSRLVAPELLVEIEADAVVSDAEYP